MPRNCPPGATITGFDRDGNAICDGGNSSSNRRRTPNSNRNRRTTPNRNRRTASRVRQNNITNRTNRRRPNPTRGRNVISGNNQGTDGYELRPETVEIERQLGLPEGTLHENATHPRLDQAISNGELKIWPVARGTCSGTSGGLCVPPLCNAQCPGGTNFMTGYCGSTGGTWVSAGDGTGMGCYDYSNSQCVGRIHCWSYNPTN